ncbi:MAG: PKD domain-containing protein [Bacteroidia bacterium]
MKNFFLSTLILISSVAAVMAQPNCTFTYTADTTNCTYTFYAPAELFANPTQYNIIWSYGNGSGFGSGSPFTAAYNGPTTDAVTMTVYMNDSNLLCYSTQIIQICGGGNNNPGCTVVAQNNGVSNTYGFSVPGANYPATWTFPDGTTTSGWNATYTFPGPGVYQVCANITGGGFTCNDCETIYIYDDTTNTNPGGGCDANFYASTSALTGYFIPYGFNFNTNAVTGTANYFWDFGDGSTSTEVYPYHVYNQAGIYNVCMVVSSSNTCADTVCQNVFIPENNTIPNDTSCQAYFVMTQQSPFEVTVVNASTAANALYTWTISGNGVTLTAEGAYPSMTIETTGSYGLCLTITAGNCTSTYCDSLVIGTDGMMGGRLSDLGFTINVTSPQAITGYDITGIETSTLDVNIYPNPSEDNFVIAGLDNGTYSITAIDGKQLAVGQITHANQLIDARNLANGVYFLTVWNTAGERAIQRIVKH